MLQLAPHNRLTMAEVVASPWMLGETATHEAVWNEFTNRKLAIQQQKQLDAESKATIKKQSVKKGENDNQKVYMAGELDDEDEEIKDQPGDELRKMEDYEEKTFLTSVVFSEQTPRTIFEKLKKQLEDFNVVPELHSNKWKLTYTRVTELDDKQVKPEFCKVQVKFFKMPDQGDLKAIEFTRLGGSAAFFYEQFSALKNNFAF